MQGILNNLDISKSPGGDNLPARILKTCAKELSVHLTHLFNSSLGSGVMPTLWKSAFITPVHKGDNRKLVENYRSFSLLPIPAQCLERIVHQAIYTRFTLLKRMAARFYQRKVLRDSAGLYLPSMGLGFRRRSSSRCGLFGLL